MSKIHIDDYYWNRGLLGHSICPKKFHIDLEGKNLEESLKSEFPKGLELSEYELRRKFKTSSVWVEFDTIWGDNLVNSLIVNPVENVGAFSATHCRGYMGGGGKNFHTIYGVTKKEDIAYGNLLFHEECKLNMKALYLYAKILSVNSNEVKANLRKGYEERNACFNMKEDLY